jgi:hypothetical protein
MELKSAGRLRPNPFTQHPSRNHRHSLVAIMIFAGQRSWLLPICFMKNGVFKSAHSSRRTRQETGTLLSSQSYRISFLACRLLKAAHNVRIVSKYLALGPRSNSPNLWSRSSPGELFRKPNESAWVRSALSHGGKLLSADHGGWGFTPKQLGEGSDSRAVWQIVQLVLLAHRAITSRSYPTHFHVLALLDP